MRQFDHEKLSVYQLSKKFVAWISELLESVPLNIAEGNGKYTPKDRCKFFDNARGSALECEAAFDVLVAKRKIKPETAEIGKAMLLEAVSMVVGLIRSNSPDRDV